MPTEPSRRTSKWVVANPHKGDRGDAKRGGSVVERIVRKLTGGIRARRPDYQTSHSDYAKVLEPDYCKARLLEIGVGRRFWQSNQMLTLSTSAWSNRCDDSIARSRGKTSGITATDNRTPIAVEIIGQVDLTKVSKQ